MVHFDNLRSIFQRRAILSKESVVQELTAYQSIAYEEVQSLRDRIFVWDFSKRTFRGLHSYVPFYLRRSRQCFLCSTKRVFKMRLLFLK